MRPYRTKIIQKDKEQEGQEEQDERELQQEQAEQEEQEGKWQSEQDREQERGQEEPTQYCHHGISHCLTIHGCQQWIRGAQNCT